MTRANLLFIFLLLFLLQSVFFEAISAKTAAAAVSKAAGSKTFLSHNVYGEKDDIVKRQHGGFELQVTKKNITLYKLDSMEKASLKEFYTATKGAAWTKWDTKIFGARWNFTGHSDPCQG